MDSREPSGRLDFDAAYVFAVVDVETDRSGVAKQRRFGAFHGLAKSVDELRAGSRRQPVHAPRAVAGIVEIADDRERQAIAIGEPLDRGTRFTRDELDERVVRLAVGLGLDISCEQLTIIGDAERFLEARAGGRDQPGRKRRRSARRGIALDQYDLGAGFARGERRAKSGRAGADNDDVGAGAELGRRRF